jgi:hypothetical protein
MATLTDYKGLQVVDPDPTGDGGLAIQDDFKQLVDWHPRSEWAQSAAPTANDDEGDDFYPGSHWLRTNTSPSQLFVCQSSAAAAAVWVQLVTPDMDVQFGTVNVTDNLLIGTTSNVTANGTAVLVFGSNGGTDPTFAANTWGLWMNSSTLKTNAGTIQVDPPGTNASALAIVDRAGTGVGQYRIYTNGVPRWVIGVPTGSDETGSNNGADLQFHCYSDAGTFIATPITIKRSTGVTTFNKGVTFADHVTVNDGKNVALQTTTGTKWGTAATQKQAWWGATPVVQPSGSAQAALTDSTGGTADGTLAAVSGTGDDATINNNFADVYTLLNAMRTALVNTGLMKGSA